MRRRVGHQAGQWRLASSGRCHVEGWLRPGNLHSPPAAAANSSTIARALGRVDHVYPNAAPRLLHRPRPDSDARPSAHPPLGSQREADAVYHSVWNVLRVHEDREAVGTAVGCPAGQPAGPLRWPRCISGGYGRGATTAAPRQGGGAGEPDDAVACWPIRGTRRGRNQFLKGVWVPIWPAWPVASRSSQRCRGRRVSQADLWALL